MLIRALQPQDAAAFQALRLRGLAEEGAAFASSVEEEAGTPIDEVARRLQVKPDGALFGAFDAGTLVGVIAVQREGMKKLSHKAIIWGVYVAPEARARGVGARLLETALQHAWTTLRVRQVNLGVNTLNRPALRLYKRLGFEVFGTELGALRVNGALHDEHHMVCRAPGEA